MRELPIIFRNDEMIQSILRGEKTQTLRPIKPQPVLTDGSGFSYKSWLSGAGPNFKDTCQNFIKSQSPFQVGDWLWVREAWHQHYEGGIPQFGGRPCYRADGTCSSHIGWDPSTRMSRGFSRITLEITDVQVQRIQEVNEEDAKAEGVKEPETWVGVDGAQKTSYVIRLHSLWDSLYRKTFPWSENPWVWAVKFKVLKF